MSQRASPTKVGAFVVGAAVLAVAAVLLFGSSRWFDERTRFVIYFDQSLMGLSVGSPVIFQGVQVGTVSDIHLVLADIDPPLIETPVFIELVEGQVREPEHTPKTLKGAAGVLALIETGLRAQLNLQSLVTGQLYVDLVIAPDTPARMRGEGEAWEIPSIRSDLQFLKETALYVAQELRKLPLDELGVNLVVLLQNLSDLADDPAMREGLAQFNAAIRDVRAVIDRAGSTLDGGYREYLELTGQLREVLTRAEDALADIDGLVAPGSPLRYELQATLDEVRRSTEKLGALADTVLDQPDVMLFGRGREGESP